MAKIFKLYKDFSARDYLAVWALFSLVATLATFIYINADELRQKLIYGLERIPMTYSPPYNSLQKGHRFSVDQKYLKLLKIPPPNFVTLTYDYVMQEKFVFVTAASDNHFVESKDSIASVQKFKPSHKIVYFDLGLTSEQIMELQTICNVIYKKFNFSKYPSFHRKLNTFGWKPMVIQEALNEFGGVIWMDASVRLATNDFLRAKKQVLSTKGVVLLSGSTNSPFSCTNPQMYEYLPTITAELKTKHMTQATFMLLYLTRETYWDVLHWWYLCALERACIAPVYDGKTCMNSDDKMTTYLNCHRYDQSALCIILLNKFRFKQERFFNNDHIAQIIRYPTNTTQIQYC